jgi:hypothetical protein
MAHMTGGASPPDAESPSKRSIPVRATCHIVDLV